MLKVKDGIKLEELEKYGFKFNSDKGMDYWSYQDKYVSYKEVLIPVWNREIVYLNGCDILYDLITAGIVVKE